jgi:cell division protein FtsA
MKNLLQRLLDRFKGSRTEAIYGDQDDYEYDGEYDGEEDPGDVGSQRQLFTALDIGTAFAKAMIVEVRGDHAEVLGVGRHPQSYAHMSDGIVTDIPGVIANCNEALLRVASLHHQP